MRGVSLIYYHTIFWCRVGVANFISLLVQKVGSDIKPYTSMLLKLLFTAVKEEKSATSKRAYANACATILKYSTPSQAHKLVEDTVALHTGDKNSQSSCALLLKSYSSTASDVLSGYQTIIVPVIFISRLVICTMLFGRTVSQLYTVLAGELTVMLSQCIDLIIMCVLLSGNYSSLD